MCLKNNETIYITGSMYKHLMLLLLQLHCCFNFPRPQTKADIEDGGSKLDTITVRSYLMSINKSKDLFPDIWKIARAGDTGYSYKIPHRKRSISEDYEDDDDDDVLHPEGLDNERIVELFNDYYKCIQKKYAERRTQEDTISAMLSEEGQDIELTCNLCLRPDQPIHSYNIMWKRLQQAMGGESVIEPGQDGGRFTFTHRKSLLIRGVDVLDAGQYFCLNDGEYEVIYQLDVLFHENRRVIQEMDNSMSVLPEVYLVDNNIHLFTTWSQWSQCNRCNENGLRRKVGICTVKKIEKHKPVKPYDVPTLQFYPDGVPCRSTVLPKHVSKLNQVKHRQSETLLGPCFIPCPTAAAVENVTDMYGNVIQQVEIEYYAINEKPTLPAHVKRDVIYKEGGKKMILKCPTDKPTKMLRWQNGTDVINPLTIKRKSRGRVRIDHANRLLVRRVKIWDTAAYNCWDGDRHIATIKVVVTTAFNTNLKQYISYAGCALTLLGMLIMAGCICCRSNKKTLK